MHGEKIKKFKIESRYLNIIRPEEVVRLGILREGIQLVTNEIRLPIYGQVIPRIELDLVGAYFNKRVTVRINQESHFLYDGERIQAMINDEIIHVNAKICFDESRNKVGMYNFGMMRENGARSFVFDYHTYCCYSCKFCFKENEWENYLIEGKDEKNYELNFNNCIEYVQNNSSKLKKDYDIIWLCTGSILDYKLELYRNCKIANTLRQEGYTGQIYLSQVIPNEVIIKNSVRTDFFKEIKRAGVNRFNSGIEIVNTYKRNELINGYKKNIKLEDYLMVFKDAINVFGHHNVGSCLLVGIEEANDTIGALEKLARLGVVPAPTVFTPFVTKQLQIPFVLSLDELVYTHIEFNRIINLYNLPVFSGVFSLA